jgi:hypothetical protein
LENRTERRSAHCRDGIYKGDFLIIINDTTIKG